MLKTEGWSVNAASNCSHFYSYNSWNAILYLALTAATLVSEKQRVKFLYFDVQACQSINKIEIAL